MSDCEIEHRSTAATVNNRLLFRSEHVDEQRDGVPRVKGVKEVRLVLPSVGEIGDSVDRSSGKVDCSADASRVFVDEAWGSEGARSNEYVSVGARVSADQVFGGLNGKMEDNRPSEAESGEGTIICDGARFPDAGAGKGEHGSGYFSSMQSLAVTGFSNEVGEEVTEATMESGQTRVPSGYISSSEVLEASEARDGWMNGFQVGDMVWGKVKSHPWWPGHIFNEAFASPSVRRTKREGHVLVAFFGDSSYGWFDPAELVHFDSHYAEKSRQTTSRNFTKAVEEAVDEASRRCALGLSCRCRNPSNFRPTTVAGYFAVDVAGYEPGGVYSSKQIRKARDNFVAVEVLSFVNQLAMKPQDSEQGSIDLIKKTSTLLALRKAMFEEFDVTYAEAFGVQLVLPSRTTQGGLDQQEKVPFRAAPLSGPLVIAEALGERKTSSKAVVRAKDTTAKKNKYLFKRREEATPTAPSLKSPPPSVLDTKQRPPSLPTSSTSGQAPAGLIGAHFSQVEAPNVHYIPHGQADVIVAAGGGSYAADVGNYVLQKRVPEKQQTREERGKPPVPEFGTFPEEGLPGAAEPSCWSHPPGRDMETPKISEVSDVKRLKTEQQPAGEEKAARVLPLHEGGSIARVGSVDDRKSLHHEYWPAVDAMEAMRLKAPVTFADADVKPNFLQPVTDQAKQVEHMGFTGSAPYGSPSAMDVEAHQRRLTQTQTASDVVKKKKALKHPREDHRSEGELDGEKKKRRKKKEGGLETSVDHPPVKHKKTGESLTVSTGKSIGIGLSHADNSVAGLEMKLDGAHNSSTPSDSATQQLPKLDLASYNLELPAVLGDLSALALDPFYGAERNAAAVVRHVLLRFRSRVYEKSLSFSPTAEHEASEPPVKFRAARPPQEPSKENAGVVAEGESLKPAKGGIPKPVVKHDDPSKMVRKRLPSDRQEEKLAKRLKKLEKLKALTSEKKAGLVNKTTEVQPRGEQKDTAAVVAPVKTVRSDSNKKQEAAGPPPKAAIPTYLVMKFPQRTTLPSISSLKARFARFGPLDLTGTRVFWKSYTCKVLFKHKPDAQAAYNYAQGTDIFGQVKVTYFVRELEQPAPDAASDPVKRQADARPDDTPQLRPVGGGDAATELRPPAMTHQNQHSGQLKSILKKPSGDEAAPAGAATTKEAPRVKFMLGGDESRAEPQVVVTGSNNGVSNTGGIPSSTAPLDINRKIPKSVTFLQPLQPPLQPPLRSLDVHTLPSTPVPRAVLPGVPDPRGGLQFSKPPPHQARYGEMEARERGAVDISHQMLSLLARCSDVVTNVTSLLGYAPYHPL